VSVAQVLRQENEKANRFFSQLTQQTESFITNFSAAAARLVDLLPVTENYTVLQLSNPALVLSKDQLAIETITSPASHEKCDDAFVRAQQRSHTAQTALRNLVKKIHAARCLHCQMGRQLLHNRRYCVETVFAFLGRTEFLPILSDATFMYEEIEAPPVIQEIEHAEEGASRNEEMAALNVAHKLADNVLQLGHNPPETQPEAEKIHLLEYNRHPEAFRLALAEGAPLQECRAALESAGHKWLLDSGAKVFVQPWQYAQVAIAIFEQGIHLRPYHVLVAESLEYHVEASLADLSYRQGARVRKRQVFANVDISSSQEHDEAPSRAAMVRGAVWCATRLRMRPRSSEISKDNMPNVESKETVDIPFVTQRTFICEAPYWRNQQSVTQSTTEVHGGGLNPRRVTVPSSC